VRALIDTDPMFTQVQNVTGTNLFGKCSSVPKMVEEHTHLFTFGENIGGLDCDIPGGGRRWIPTRQPIVVKHWPESTLPNSGPYTTVLNWIAARDFEFDGRTWGQKNVEFMRFLKIPRQAAGTTFRVGVGQTTGDPFPAGLAHAEGWDVVDAQTVAYDVASYQQFIQSSKVEFSVAKHTYVQARTGWFSCRSACYLASCRPVVTQDTGWSAFVPNGRGLFAFSDAEGALAAIRQIESEPEVHARAARAIAVEAFDSEKVLARMLAEMGVSIWKHRSCTY
jgi:hypothetical protein